MGPVVHAPQSDGVVGRAAEEHIWCQSRGRFSGNIREHLVGGEGIMVKNNQKQSKFALVLKFQVLATLYYYYKLPWMVS